MLLKKCFMVESLPVLFIGAGARAGPGVGEKKIPEPAPQHCDSAECHLIIPGAEGSSASRPERPQLASSRPFAPA